LICNLTEFRLFVNIFLSRKRKKVIRRSADGPQITLISAD